MLRSALFHLSQNQVAALYFKEKVIFLLFQVIVEKDLTSTNQSNRVHCFIKVQQVLFISQILVEIVNIPAASRIIHVIAATSSK